MKEVWKAVPGYRGYEVSNLGRVRSYRKQGRGTALRDKPRLLALKRDRDNYRVVDLCRIGEKPKSKKVHRLVIEAFIGPIPEGMHVCHQNGRPFDNRLENLRVDTPAANQADREKHGTLVEGEKVHAARLSVLEVKQLRLMIGGVLNQSELAEAFGVHDSTLSAIKTGRTWKHVSLEGLGV
ncbi:hypothetical protein FHG89_31620 [Micromonospora orduensis]|uniref:HNH endonuclease n=1 Tax=Micromonospora orduensis TaxID=1420891 RepID=A0A5C4QBR8_9ACTN|nr:HNH endonuclease [Micromonospora orduensis]TNH21439.1 hypothetical protein FHG89_31620 [Micromonospora orduensis]